MILFEEMMMDASKIFFAKIYDKFDSKKVYWKSILRIDFLPEMNTEHVEVTCKTHEEAISKLEQLTTMINLQKK